MKFGKSDLKNWDIVALRSGARYIVNIDKGYLVKGDGYEPLNLYSEEIRNLNNNDCDIDKVYRGVTLLLLNTLQELELSEGSLVYDRAKGDFCKHRDQDGKLTIDYSDGYEMRSSDMYCTQCGKTGSRKEFYDGYEMRSVDMYCTQCGKTGSKK